MMIHNTKADSVLEFSHVVLGGAYHAAESWYRACDGSIEAIFKNINPYTAVRGLEYKKYV